MKNFKSLFFTLLIILPASGQKIKEEILANAMLNMDEFIEFLSLPNDANVKDDIYRLIDWTERKFQSLKFNTKLLDTDTFPLMLAEKKVNDSSKNILIYLHLDGQPIDVSKWDQEDPFSPVFKIRNNNSFSDINWDSIKDLSFDQLESEDVRIFARSSSDAKGPVMMIIQALKIYAIK